MHHSRLAGLVVDTPRELEPAARFWAAVFGASTRPTNPQHPTYRELESPRVPVQLLVQAVTHEARVHLDIETDDQEAEVARLEGLGARKVGWVKNWWVMEAPSGHRFCVVQPQRGALTDENSTRWP